MPVVPRAIERDLPEAVANAVVYFLYGPLAEDPYSSASPCASSRRATGRPGAASTASSTRSTTTRCWSASCDSHIGSTSTADELPLKHDPSSARELEPCAYVRCRPSDTELNPHGLCVGVGSPASDVGSSPRCLKDCPGRLAFFSDARWSSPRRQGSSRVRQSRSTHSSPRPRARQATRPAPAPPSFSRGSPHRRRRSPPRPTAVCRSGRSLPGGRSSTPHIAARRSPARSAPQRPGRPWVATAGRISRWGSPRGCRGRVRRPGVGPSTPGGGATRRH